jgi:hypothetical protein
MLLQCPAKYQQRSSHLSFLKSPSQVLLRFEGKHSRSLYSLTREKKGLREILILTRVPLPHESLLHIDFAPVSKVQQSILESLEHG